MGAKAPLWEMAKTNIRPFCWLSFFVFFIGFVLFFVAYTNHDWFVEPPYEKPFPQPDTDKRDPVKFGLFWMCVRGHCIYDLEVDYMIVKYITNKNTQYNYQNYRTACMAIITIAAIHLLLALGSFLFFLGGFSYSFIGGFVAGILQVICVIFTLIGIILFGARFSIGYSTLPLGWCYWMAVCTVPIFLLSTALAVLLAIIMLLNGKQRGGEENSALQQRSGYFGKKDLSL